MVFYYGNLLIIAHKDGWFQMFINCYFCMHHDLMFLDQKKIVILKNQNKYKKKKKQNV
jgi:hypothetical protein